MVSDPLLSRLFILIVAEQILEVVPKLVLPTDLEDAVLCVVDYECLGNGV